MTPLEQAQRDAAHARDELERALCIIVRLSINTHIDNKLLNNLGYRSDEREKVLERALEFERNFAPFPPVEA
jgi:hypothetical protein